MGRWAIADGVLRISKNVYANDQLLQNEDDNEKKDIIKQLAANATALAVWEMKSLTVGPAQVMQEIAKMGQNSAKFPWKKCTGDCNHQSLENMKEAEKSYEAGPDPRSPPWKLPVVLSADSRPISRRKSLRSASARGGTTTGLSHEEPSMSTVEDGEGERKKRPLNDPDVSEPEEPPSKKPRKSKADSTDKTYEPPTRPRKEVNAESFLQQVP
jgi:hypothetical protein